MPSQKKAALWAAFFYMVVVRNDHTGDGASGLVVACNDHTGDGASGLVVACQRNAGWG